MSGGGSKPGERRGGRKKGSKNHATEGIREIAGSLVDDPAYRAALKARLEAGTAGAMETTLWAYAYGRIPVTDGNGTSLPATITITF